MNRTPVTLASELHDPFLMESGRRVKTPEEWPERRAEIAGVIQSVMYGKLPPAPDAPRLETIRDGRASALGGARHNQVKIFPFADSDFSFLLHLYLPGKAPDKFPVILSGDGCWHNASPEVIQSVLGRGYALLVFNRCEIVPDVPPGARDGVFQRRFPGSDFGALAAWAWGYHRVMDILPEFPELDAARVAVAGHSRGGKASLLAGALDERIAVVSANNSGAGGAGCERFKGPGAESLDAMLGGGLAAWFTPALGKYRGKMGELPMDQHFVKALCAPRPLLTTEALGDLWANPSGTWLTHLAAREVYAFLGAENAIGVHYREGGHRHGLDDFNVLLDFCDLHFFKKPADMDFGKPPAENLPGAFSWRGP